MVLEIKQYFQGFKLKSPLPKTTTGNFEIENRVYQKSCPPPIIFLIMEIDIFALGKFYKWEEEFFNYQNGVLG